MKWSDEEDKSSSIESSLSQSDSDADEDSKSGKRKSIAVDFDTLKRHGYKDGGDFYTRIKSASFHSPLSTLQPIWDLRVPPLEENEKQDWSRSTGRKTRENRDTEESYEERQKTRAAFENREQLLTVQTREEKNNVSFSQKEKRKREPGRASRGERLCRERKENVEGMQTHAISCSNKAFT
ncbi:hypothetical protein SDJN02_12008, partial [Cucurbita argyrosperma subsp. argyrosperma]